METDSLFDRTLCRMSLYRSVTYPQMKAEAMNISTNILNI